MEMIADLDIAEVLVLLSLLLVSDGGVSSTLYWLLQLYTLCSRMKLSRFILFFFFFLKRANFLCAFIKKNNIKVFIFLGNATPMFDSHDSRSTASSMQPIYDA